FKQVSNQTVVRDLEDRRFLVLVDRNNDFGVLHTGQMLDRAGDTDGDVQARSNDLAGLTDLHVVRYKARVHRSTRGTDSGAQLVGQTVQQLEVVAILHAPTTGNDDLGTRQFGAVGLGQFFANEGGGAGVLGRGNGFHRRTATFSSNRVETGGAHGDDLDRRVGLDGGDGVTGVDRALEGIGAFYRDDLGDLINVQQRGNARQVVLAVGAGRGQDVAVVLAQLGDQQGDVLRQLVRVGSVVGQQDLGDACHFGGVASQSGVSGPGGRHVNGPPEGSGSRSCVQGGALQCGVVAFSKTQNRLVRPPWPR